MSKSTPIPFSEPPWLMGIPSPYYSNSHRKWQKICRELVDELLMKDVAEWEREGDVPKTLYQSFVSANLLIPNLPYPLPLNWLKRLNITHLPGGLRIEDFDYLHTLIYIDELSRCGSLGPGGSVTIGFAFGLPPILKFGSQELQERFVPDILTGRKRICIAVTEPGAGSDVSGIETTATKTKDGRGYLVNGSKKWITNGLWSDYASMVVRTGGSGAGGLSMLVVPLLNTKGVEMRRIQVAGQRTAGTTFIELDEVFVPLENLIGKEGHGMKYAMQNFNHERLTISITANRVARVALSSAFEYVMKREAFGKTLVQQPVVRHRLAKAGAELESHWAWTEGFVYAMTEMGEEDANRELGGLTALAKAQAGRVLKVCADTAVLLFGGNGYTKSGLGEVAERIYREVPGVRIPGGSEDVMLDLAIRQLVKNYQQKTKELENEMKRPGSSSKL